LTPDPAALQSWQVVTELPRQPEPDRSPAPEPPDEPIAAPRRTRLAAERTQLAWWRTGLTAIAVGLGIGRVIPDIAGTAEAWPYVATGIAFTLYGIVLFAYGTHRARDLEQHLGGPRPVSASDRMLTALTAFGVLLGLASIALIAAQ
jgi:putative membrane protein